MERETEVWGEKRKQMNSRCKTIPMASRGGLLLDLLLSLVDEGGPWQRQPVEGRGSPTPVQGTLFGGRI